MAGLAGVAQDLGADVLEVLGLAGPRSLDQARVRRLHIPVESDWLTTRPQTQQVLARRQACTSVCCRKAARGFHDVLTRTDDELKSRGGVGFHAILEDLVPSDDPARTGPFEQAVHDLGEHLGIPPQRPERDTGQGPDVLWSLGEFKYLVIECKSGVTTDSISKHDAAQLSHSMDWFAEKYDTASSAVPVLIQPTRVLHHRATARAGAMIITFDRLADLRSSVEQFAVSMTSVDLQDSAEVGSRLNDAGLNSGSFIARWGRSARSQ